MSKSFCGIFMAIKGRFWSSEKLVELANLAEIKLSKAICKVSFQIFLQPIFARVLKMSRPMAELTPNSIHIFETGSDFLHT